jgi:hypothetical protein
MPDRQHPVLGGEPRPSCRCRRYSAGLDVTARATNIEEEGVYIDNFKIVDQGTLLRGGAG